MTTQNWSEDPLAAAPSGERVSSGTPAGGPSGGSGSSPGMKDEAKTQAKEVGHEGADAAKDVAHTAGAEAKNVAHEAGAQAKNLLGELGSDVKAQAGASQQKAAESLRSLSEELSSMAENGEQDGPAKDLVRQAAQRSGDAAGWLEARDPGSLVEEVKGFARRKPGTFLLVAAGAGLLAGRLTRGLTGANSDSESAGGNASPANPAPEHPPTVPAQPRATAQPPVIATGEDPLAGEPVITPGTRPLDDRRFDERPGGRDLR